MVDGGRAAPHGRCPFLKAWGETLRPERGCFLGGTVCLPARVQDELREAAVQNRARAPYPADGPGLRHFPSADSKNNAVNGASATFRTERWGGPGRGTWTAAATRCVGRQRIPGGQVCSAPCGHPHHLRSRQEVRRQPPGASLGRKAVRYAHPINNTPRNTEVRHQG